LHDVSRRHFNQLVFFNYEFEYSVITTRVFNKIRNPTIFGQIRSCDTPAANLTSHDGSNEYWLNKYLPFRGNAEDDTPVIAIS